jgi:hypothetical protein
MMRVFFVSTTNPIEREIVIAVIVIVYVVSISSILDIRY